MTTQEVAAIQLAINDYGGRAHEHYYKLYNVIDLLSVLRSNTKKQWRECLEKASINAEDVRKFLADLTLQLGDAIEDFEKSYTNIVELTSRLQDKTESMKPLDE